MEGLQRETPAQVTYLSWHQSTAKPTEEGDWWMNLLSIMTSLRWSVECRDSRKSGASFFGSAALAEMFSEACKGSEQQANFCPCNGCIHGDPVHLFTLPLLKGYLDISGWKRYSILSQNDPVYFESLWPESFLQEAMKVCLKKSIKHYLPKGTKIFGFPNMETRSRRSLNSTAFQWTTSLQQWNQHYNF